MKRAVCSFTSMSLLNYRTLKIYSTQLDVWLTVAEYGEETSIHKAKSVHQLFHTTAECAFLYAGLNTYLTLQVNVTENNRILRDDAHSRFKKKSIEDLLKFGKNRPDTCRISQTCFSHVSLNSSDYFGIRCVRIPTLMFGVFISVGDQVAIA